MFNVGHLFGFLIWISLIQKAFSSSADQRRSRHTSGGKLLLCARMTQNISSTVKSTGVEESPDLLVRFWWIRIILLKVKQAEFASEI